MCRPLDVYVLKSCRFVFLFSLAASLSFAQTWFGRLVDSKCYESEERNINPKDTLRYVDRDQNWEIRFCAAKAKTKSFTIVEPDGESFRLDAAGNAKAAELQRTMGRHPHQLYVTVTGELAENTLKVDSIVAAK